MKKEKLSLKSLNVTSFVTNDKGAMNKVRGGYSDPDPCGTAETRCSCPPFCGGGGTAGCGTGNLTDCCETVGYTGICLC